jgi:hypothetical protein
VILTALLIAQFALLGTAAVVPWRLATGSERARRIAAFACVPLLLLSLLLALYHLVLRPDAAIAWGLVWPPRTVAARWILVTAFAGAAGALLTALGGTRFEPAAWRTAAVLAGLLAAGAAFGGELLRLGAGPYAGPSSLAVAVVARFAVSLAAGESLTGTPRWLAPFAGLLLPIAHFTGPAPLRLALAPDLPTLLAASALFLAAPLLPVRFARASALLAVALAALFYARAALVSATWENRQFFPERPPAATAPVAPTVSS